MFRVHDSEASPPGYFWVGRIVLVTLLFALFTSLSLSWLILQEQRRLTSWMQDPSGLQAEAIVSMRDLVRLQLADTLLVAAILLVCTLSPWWLRRRYHHTQQSLRQVKMHAHDILASMDRGVVTTDLEGVVTSINSAGIRLLGVDRECVGLPLRLLSSEDLPLLEVFAQVVGKQQPLRDRDVSVNCNGRTVRLCIDGDVLRDMEGQALGCVIHLRDVTERMLMEERMRRMERFLGLASLASGLHHEIKNPLTALSIHVQLLEEYLNNPRARGGEGTERPLLDDELNVEEIVGVLRTEVCRLNGVLESFRTFANLQHLTVRPTDGLEVVEKALRLIRPQAAEQGVAVSLLHPVQDLPPVLLDADKFEQVVLNLLLNALEAMPDGGALTVSVAVEEGDFRVAVKDSGAGIPEEAQRHLFQPYFSTKGKGTGMGLALSEKLVSQHGGSIGYATGQSGTTFRIAVPLRQQGPAT
jgi:PAS domain S-box-containing protein